MTFARLLRPGEVLVVHDGEQLFTIANREGDVRVRPVVPREAET